MIAPKVVMDARAAGIQIEAQGDDLLLKAPVAPSPTMLALLSKNKCEILLWLRSKETGWSAEDWHAYFDERAAIAEFDGGLTRRQAEERAFCCCVSQWLTNCWQGRYEGRRIQAELALRKIGICKNKAPSPLTKRL